MNQQSTEVTGVTDKTGTGAVEDRTGGDADSAEDLTAADNTDEGCTSSGDGRATDEARLLERGVELHALSTDEGERERLGRGDGRAGPNTGGSSGGYGGPGRE